MRVHRTGHHWFHRIFRHGGHCGQCVRCYTKEARATMRTDEERAAFGLTEDEVAALRVRLGLHDISPVRVAAAVALHGFRNAKPQKGRWARFRWEARQAWGRRWWR